MRPVLVALAFTVALFVTSLPSSGQVDSADGGVPLSIATAPVETAPSESLPLRLGKALVFAVVVSAFLFAGGMWRRGRRKRRPKRQS